MYLSIRATSSSVDSSGPDFSLMPRKSTICLVLWPKVNLSPRDSTGTERAPSFCSSARPAGSSRTLTETKSIPRTDRNSLSLRQLVQPGCQNTLNGGMRLLPLQASIDGLHAQQVKGSLPLLEIRGEPRRHLGRRRGLHGEAQLHELLRDFARLQHGPE